jgi:phosphate transport system substrate-binding protein
MYRLYFLCLFFAFNACDSNEENSFDRKIKIKASGSETMHIFMRNIVNNFNEESNTHYVMYSGLGSNQGIQSLISGESDIIFSSRDLTADEVKAITEKNIKISITELAYDGLHIIVNSKNEINKLSKEELKQIYTGKIKNWNTLTGVNERIYVYARNSNSGTHSYFKKEVLDDENYLMDCIFLESNEKIVEAVSKNLNAIGYVGAGYNAMAVKTLAIDFTNQNNYVLPEYMNIENRTYPLSRALYMIYNIANEDKLKPFIQILYSSSTREIIRQSGFIPAR